MDITTSFFRLMRALAITGGKKFRTRASWTSRGKWLWLFVFLGSVVTFVYAETVENNVNQALELYKQGKNAEAAKILKNTAEVIEKQKNQTIQGSIEQALEFYRAGDHENAAKAFDAAANLIRRKKGGATLPKPPVPPVAKTPPAAPKASTAPKQPPAVVKVPPPKSAAPEKVANAPGQAFAVLGIAEWDYKQVIGADECGECHEDSIRVWKETQHFKSYRSLTKEKESKAIAKKVGERRIKSDKSQCAACHYAEQEVRGKAKIVAGVTCESCHAPAKNWVEVHNNYGGKGIKKEDETPENKKKRFASVDKAGMIRTDVLYLWAKNCYQCHLVADEKMINVGEHPVGDKFDLISYSLGEVRHVPEVPKPRQRVIHVLNYAVELELSLRALSNAGGGKYADSMKKRAERAIAALTDLAGKSGNVEIKKIVDTAKRANLAAGSAALKTAADAVAVLAMNFASSEKGDSLGGIDGAIPGSDKYVGSSVF